MNQVPNGEIEHLKGWIGRQEVVQDRLDLATLRRIRAFFSMAPEVAEGDPVDELWHWCFFHPALAPEGLGPDGHPMTGGFLPPFRLPRRMWGGSRLAFQAPLRAGQLAEKRSRILSVDLKQGSAGPLGLVRVEHEIFQDGGLCRREEQDIVYRAPSGDGPGALRRRECPEGAVHSEQVRPDPVMLFRYSALSYNPHRIHYDRDYATRAEGYSGLVVQGPLTASLLARFARRHRGGAPLTAFSFRGTSPLFDGAVATLKSKPEGRGESLWVENAQGGLAMSANAEF